MSIQRIRRRFAVHLRYMLYVLIAVFAVTLPLVFAPGGLSPTEEEQGSQKQQEVVAQVDGSPLRRSELERQFTRTAGQKIAIYESIGQSIGVERIARFRLEALEEAILQHLLLGEAVEQGISVSRREVGKRAEQVAQQQLDQLKLQFKGKELEQRLAQIASATDGRERRSMSERSFRSWLTKRMVEQHSQDLKDDLIVEKLRTQAVASVSATEQELLESCDRVTLREILVSRHPRGKPERTEEEARKRAEELLARVKKGADFAEVARTESDDEDARYTGGLKSPMAPSRLRAEWREATANLKVGEISELIKTDRGYVVVRVEERGRELPEDFQKNKQQLLKDFVEQKRNNAWNEHQQQLRAKANVKVTDPEMLAYQELEKGDFDKALPLLQEAAASADQLSGTAAGAVYYQLATILSARNQWEEAAEAYAFANDALSREGGMPGARAWALMGMGRSYENLGDLEEAAIWYQAASDATDVPSIHEQLRGTYQRIGNQELVEREQQWLDDYHRAEEERRQALEAQQRRMEEEAAKRRPKPGAAPVAPITKPK